MRTGRRMGLREYEVGLDSINCKAALYEEVTVWAMVLFDKTNFRHHTPA